MATATITFTDTEEGTSMSIDFDDPLPADPNDATDAQAQALIAFQSLMFLHAQEDFSENGHEEFTAEVDDEV